MAAPPKTPAPEAPKTEKTPAEKRAAWAVEANRNVAAQARVLKQAERLLRSDRASENQIKHLRDAMEQTADRLASILAGKTPTPTGLIPTE